MRRKLTEYEMKTLVFFLLFFLFLSWSISFGIFLWCAFVHVTENVALIAFIHFSISLIYYFKSKGYLELCEGVFEFLRKRNEKIDEEEKAQLQAKAQAKADKETAEVQIWVNV